MAIKTVTTKRVLFYSLSFFLVIGFSKDAEACGMCQASAFWILFPPILIWSCIGSIWFFLYLIAAAFWRHKIRYIPGLFAGLLLLFFGWFAGAAMMGPITILPFLFVSFAVWIKYFRYTSKLQYSIQFLKIIRFIGIIAMLLICLTTLSEIISPTPRTPIDILLSKWGRSGYSIYYAFNKLKKMEPYSIKDYRIILQKVEGLALIQAANRIAKIGNADIDIPLLINALKKIRGIPSQWYADDIENIIREMRSLDLPNKTPADIWKKHWIEKVTSQTVHDAI